MLILQPLSKLFIHISLNQQISPWSVSLNLSITLCIFDQEIHPTIPVDLMTFLTTLQLIPLMWVNVLQNTPDFDKFFLFLHGFSRSHYSLATSSTVNNSMRTVAVQLLPFEVQWLTQLSAVSVRPLNDIAGTFHFNLLKYPFSGTATFISTFFWSTFLTWIVATGTFCIQTITPVSSVVQENPDLIVKLVLQPVAAETNVFTYYFEKLFPLVLLILIKMKPSNSRFLKKRSRA